MAIEIGGTPAQTPSASSVASGAVSGSDRMGIAFFSRAGLASPVPATWNDVAMTQRRRVANNGVFGKVVAVHTIADPTEGAVAMSGGSGPRQVQCLYVTGAGGIRQQGGEDVYEDGNPHPDSTDTSASATLSTQPGDLVIARISTRTQDPAVEEGSQALEQTDGDNEYANVVTRVAVGTSTEVAWSWSSAAAWHITAIVITPVASGPTINTQPQAATAVVSPSKPATFSVACAAAITSMLWGLETAVGSGVYATITHGVGGFSISTNTGAGTSTLTYTPDATTHSGKHIRGTPTDAGGSTPSNAVVLTVKAGASGTTSGTTSEAGVFDETVATDYENVAGEVLVAIDTCEGESIDVAVRGVAP